MSIYEKLENRMWSSLRFRPRYHLNSRMVSRLESRLVDRMVDRLEYRLEDVR